MAAHFGGGHELGAVDQRVDGDVTECVVERGAVVGMQRWPQWMTTPGIEFTMRGSSADPPLETGSAPESSQPRLTEDIALSQSLMGLRLAEVDVDRQIRAPK